VSTNAYPSLDTVQQKVDRFISGAEFAPLSRAIDAWPEGGASAFPAGLLTPQRPDKASRRQTFVLDQSAIAAQFAFPIRMP
jgi:hypothetical protein